MTPAASRRSLTRCSSRTTSGFRGFASAGLDAIEAYHSDHDGAATARYLELADRLGLRVSGGSDYHGDQSHGRGGLGSVSLPRERFDQLKAIGVR